MQIQVHTDHTLEGGEKFIAYVTGVVEGAMSRLSARISRIEVHVSDQNGSKTGQHDKRCMMEARLEGHPPIAVTHKAASVDEAVDGAATKLQQSLRATIDRLQELR